MVQAQSSIQLPEMTLMAQTLPSLYNNCALRAGLGRLTFLWCLTLPVRRLNVLGFLKIRSLKIEPDFIFRRIYD
jgi:hypothetical protein